jgi:hypothetical protein
MKISLRLSFDGPGGVLAHASFPTVGEIHFDDEENWLVNGARKDGYDLMWVSYFEITMFCLKIGTKASIGNLGVNRFNQTLPNFASVCNFMIQLRAVIGNCN